VHPLKVARGIRGSSRGVDDVLDVGDCFIEDSRELLVVREDGSALEQILYTRAAGIPAVSRKSKYNLKSV
jgi:hypothetical protein